MGCTFIDTYMQCNNLLSIINIVRLGSIISNRDKKKLYLSSNLSSVLSKRTAHALNCQILSVSISLSRLLLPFDIANLITSKYFFCIVSIKNDTLLCNN